MIAKFIPTTLDALLPQIQQHYSSLNGPVESFQEERVLTATLYRIELDGTPIGWAATHEEQTLTQFALTPEGLRYGQAVFQQALRLDQVKAALVPTCDALFLSHALDMQRSVAVQAHFFHAGPAASPPLPAGFACRVATPDDAELFRQHSGDFFADIEARIAVKSLFVAELDGGCVGFGIAQQGRLLLGTTSIGMFVIPSVRQTGIGTAIISWLRARCEQAGQRPVAGCWYYNHRSKRTLERAGMLTSTRLLKIEF